MTWLLIQLSEPGACHWPWQWKQTNGPREKDSVCEDAGIQDTDWGGGLQERGNPHGWAPPSPRYSILRRWMAALGGDEAPATC